jgi:thiamine-phosphate pyrophosphorylase
MGTRFVVNTRTDVAIATGCDGVHLPTDDLNPSEVKQIFASAGLQAIVGVSCHSVYEVTRAAGARADYAVFGPVFEKTAAPGVPAVGLNALREACEAASVCTPPLPVLAIGGITVANARDCLQAGASGIAAIRLFQQNDTCAVVAQLRAMLA